MVSSESHEEANFDIPETMWKLHMDVVEIDARIADGVSEYTADLFQAARVRAVEERDQFAARTDVREYFGGLVLKSEQQIEALRQAMHELEELQEFAKKGLIDPAIINDRKAKLDMGAEIEAGNSLEFARWVLSIGEIQDPSSTDTFVSESDTSQVGLDEMEVEGEEDPFEEVFSFQVAADLEAILRLKSYVLDRFAVVGVEELLADNHLSERVPYDSAIWESLGEDEKKRALEERRYNAVLVAVQLIEQDGIENIYQAIESRDKNDPRLAVLFVLDDISKLPERNELLYELTFEQQKFNYGVLRSVTGRVVDVVPLAQKPSLHMEEQPLLADDAGVSSVEETIIEGHELDTLEPDSLTEHGAVRVEQEQNEEELKKSRSHLEKHDEDTIKKIAGDVFKLAEELGWRNGEDTSIHLLELRSIANPKILQKARARGIVRDKRNGQGAGDISNLDIVDLVRLAVYWKFEPLYQVSSKKRAIDQIIRACERSWLSKKESH